MERKNEVWRKLDEVVDAVLAMPPDAVKDEEDSGDSKPPEIDHDDSRGA